MMPDVYAFLDTTCLAASTSFEPVLRSSIAHRHRRAQARLELRDGWLVPAAYPRDDDAAQTVGVADVSHVGKLEIFAKAPPSDPAMLDSCAVGPGRFVVLCRYADLATMRERIEPGVDTLLDRTSAWSALLLTGPEAPTLLRRVSPIESPPGRGPIGKIPGTVFVRPSGFWLVFSQEFAQYVWDLALDLAEPLGGGPVGVDTARHDPLLAVRPAVPV